MSLRTGARTSSGSLRIWFFTGALGGVSVGVVFAIIELVAALAPDRIHDEFVVLGPMIGFGIGFVRGLAGGLSLGCVVSLALSRSRRALFGAAASIVLTGAVLSCGFWLYEGPRRMTEAAGRGDVDEVRSLLALGVSPRRGRPPALVNAADWGQAEVVQLLWNEGWVDDGEALVNAAQSGHAHVVAMILATGQTAGVCEALERSILSGRTQCTEILVASGRTVGCPPVEPWRR